MTAFTVLAHWKAFSASFALQNDSKKTKRNSSIVSPSRKTSRLKYHYTEKS